MSTEKKIAGNYSDWTPYTNYQAGMEEILHDEKKIEICARAAHEVNRAYCLSLGDKTQAPWDEAPEWQKVSARKGVIGALAGNTPKQSHESWLAEKREAGWVYGSEKNVEKKTHPCMMAYEDLPNEQQAKDGLFLSTARCMAVALNMTVRLINWTTAGCP